MITPLRFPPSILLPVGLLLGLWATSSGAQVPNAHLEADCNACHQLGTTDAQLLAEARSSECAACHGPTSSRPWGTSAFHGEGERTCTTCHSFHAPDEVRLPGMQPDQSASLASIAKGPAGTQDLVQCKPCHQTGGPSPTLLHPGHQAAGAWYHANVGEVAAQSISESCLRCHDRDQDLPSELGAEWNPPRPARSANHAFGIAMSPNRRGGFGIRQEVDPRLELVNGKIECTTCHDLYNTADDMLVEFETPRQLCVGCHVRTTGDEGTTVAISR